MSINKIKLKIYTILYRKFRDDRTKRGGGGREEAGRCKETERILFIIIIIIIRLSRYLQLLRL
jgi:hypothetical protein